MGGDSSARALPIGAIMGGAQGRAGDFIIKLMDFILNMTDYVLNNDELHTKNDGFAGIPPSWLEQLKSRPQAEALMGDILC